VRGLSSAIALAPEGRFARIGEAAARCRDALAEVTEVVTPADQAGLVTFRVNGEPDEVVARLFERDVVVRRLPEVPWARASCGWWTSDDDVERLAPGPRRPGYAPGGQPRSAAVGRVAADTVRL